MLYRAKKITHLITVKASQKSEAREDGRRTSLRIPQMGLVAVWRLVAKASGLEKKCRLVHGVGWCSISLLIYLCNAENCGVCTEASTGGGAR
jgi:hypothetical protein